MGIVFRQSVKSSIATLAGAVLGAALIIISTHLLPKQELGFTRTLTTFAAVGGNLLVLGFHSTVAVFIYKYPAGDPRRPALIGLCMLAPVVVVALITGIYFALKPQFLHLFQPQDVPFFDRYFLWLPLFVAFFVYQVLLESYLISQMKVAVATTIREVGLKGLNLLLVVLFGIGWLSFTGLVTGMVLVYGLSNLTLLLIASKTEAFGMSMKWSLFSKEELKEIVHFTGFHALLGVSINLLGYLDGIMLAPLDRQGLRATAVYSVALFVIALLQIPAKSMTLSTMPIMTQAYNDGNTEKVGDVFRRSSINMLLATVGMTVLIGTNLHNGLRLLGPGFEAVAPLVLILALGRIGDAATGMNDHVLSVSRYYQFNFYLSLGLVIGIIGLNALLIPRYGVFGAAWGTTIALLVYNAAKWVFVWLRLKLQPFSVATVRILLAGILAAAPVYLLPRMEPWVLDAVVRAVLVLGLYIGFLLWLKPSPDLTEYLKSIRKNKRLF